MVGGDKQVYSGRRTTPNSAISSPGTTSKSTNLGFTDLEWANNARLQSLVHWLPTKRRCLDISTDNEQIHMSPRWPILDPEFVSEPI